MAKEDKNKKKELIKLFIKVIGFVLGLIVTSNISIKLSKYMEQKQTVQILTNYGVHVENKGFDYGDTINILIEKLEDLTEVKTKQEKSIIKLKEKNKTLEEKCKIIKEERENQIYLIAFNDASTTVGIEAGFSPKDFLETIKKVYIMAHINHFTYGHSTALPPCADKLISSDRLIARALWELGMQDQIEGGEQVGLLPNYLETHGFYRVTDINSLSPGDIVFMGKVDGSELYSYPFVVVSYDPISGVCYKYDMYLSTEKGESKIEMIQPFYEQIVPYSHNTCFTCAYRIK